MEYFVQKYDDYHKLWDVLYKWLNQNKSLINVQS